VQSWEWWSSWKGRRGCYYGSLVQDGDDSSANWLAAGVFLLVSLLVGERRCSVCWRKEAIKENLYNNILCLCLQNNWVCNSSGFARHLQFLSFFFWRITFSFLMNWSRCSHIIRSNNVRWQHIGPEFKPYFSTLEVLFYIYRSTTVLLAHYPFASFLLIT
jgi:hypothetical protein